MWVFFVMLIVMLVLIVLLVLVLMPVLRHLAVQYGDGEAIVEFWRNDFFTYNRLGKVH